MTGFARRLGALVTLEEQPDDVLESIARFGRVAVGQRASSSITEGGPASPGGPWANVATTAVSVSSGAYSFARLAPSENTYYRALSDGATSATVRVSVRFRVGILVSRRHPVRGSRVRFHGRVGPGHNGHRVFIQWLGPRGHWNTIKRTRLGAAPGGLSSYGVRVRIERNGRYRVVVAPDSTHARGFSATVRIQTR